MGFVVKPVHLRRIRLAAFEKDLRRSTMSVIAIFPRPTRPMWPSAVSR
jgi:hypothetical protein